MGINIWTIYGRPPGDNDGIVIINFSGNLESLWVVWCDCIAGSGIKSAKKIDFRCASISSRPMTKPQKHKKQKNKKSKKSKKGQKDKTIFLSELSLHLGHLLAKESSLVNFLGLPAYLVIGYWLLLVIGYLVARIPCSNNLASNQVLWSKISKGFGKLTFINTCEHLHRSKRLVAVLPCLSVDCVISIKLLTLFLITYTVTLRIGGAWLLTMCNTVQMCVCLCLCVCEFGVFGEGGDVLKIDILQLWASSAELCASHLSLLLGHSGGQCGLEVGMCLNWKWNILYFLSTRFYHSSI